MWTSPKTPARTHYMFQMVQWSKIKALKEALNALVLKVSTKSEWKRSIEVSRGPFSTSYPCARGAQYNLIWAIR